MPLNMPFMLNRRSTHERPSRNAGGGPGDLDDQTNGWRQDRLFLILKHVSCQHPSRCVLPMPGIPHAAYRKESQRHRGRCMPSGWDANDIPLSML